MLKFLFAQHRMVCGLATQLDLFITHGIGGSRSGRSRQNDTSIVTDLLQQLAGRPGYADEIPLFVVRHTHFGCDHRYSVIRVGISLVIWVGISLATYLF